MQSSHKTTKRQYDINMGFINLYDSQLSLVFLIQLKFLSLMQIPIFNPLTAKLFYLNFQPLEVVSCRRDPQLQVGENYFDLNSFQILLFDVTFYI